MWLTSFCLGHLKNLPKEQQRFILRHFNFAIQVFTLFSYLLRGNLSLQHLPYMGILILSVSLPAMLGARLFYKISETDLDRDAGVHVGNVVVTVEEFGAGETDAIGLKMKFLPKLKHLKKSDFVRDTQLTSGTFLG